MKFKDKLKDFFKSKHFLICVIIVFSIVMIDLFTKIITDGKNIIFIDKLLNFTSAHNYGGAYSIFSSHTVVLTIFSIVMIVGIVIFDIFFADARNNILYTISLAMILGGAIGNLIDRLFLGYVRDFLELRFIDFPIFNVADIMLTVGCVLFAVFILFIYSKNNKKVENKNDN